MNISRLKTPSLENNMAGSPNLITIDKLDDELKDHPGILSTADINSPNLLGQHQIF